MNSSSKYPKGVVIIVIGINLLRKLNTLSGVKIGKLTTHSQCVKIST